MTKLKDTTEWRIIGEVCVDSGSIIICDPINAEEAQARTFHLWDSIDLNEAARKDIRTHELFNAHEAPIAVVAESGLGDGVYAVEARYETSEWGRRVQKSESGFCRIPILRGRCDGQKENRGKIPHHPQHRQRRH